MPGAPHLQALGLSHGISRVRFTNPPRFLVEGTCRNGLLVSTLGTATTVLRCNCSFNGDEHEDCNDRPGLITSFICGKCICAQPQAPSSYGNGARLGGSNEPEWDRGRSDKPERHRVV
jgi:hypothetical protein